MEPLLIVGTRSTPTILLNPHTGHFEFAGSSMPENAAEFFDPVLNWLDTTLPHLQRSTFVFRLEYFSTSSMKAFYMVLLRLQEAQRDHELVWHIEAADEFMVEAADSFEELLGIRLKRVEMDMDAMNTAAELLRTRVATFPSTNA